MKAFAGREIDWLDVRGVAVRQGKQLDHTLDRLDSFVDGVVGRRITYKELTA